jgi:hypothetical protein
MESIVFSPKTITSWEKALSAQLKREGAHCFRIRTTAEPLLGFHRCKARPQGRNIHFQGRHPVPL